ncbi:MAG: hypothetical protein D6816_10710 [Bacteroidetes bacterium]|nr:MAG: hypothetical protein D6816_10710 [Bacteroidota bacterium]
MAEEHLYQLCEDQDCALCSDNEDVVWSEYVRRWLHRDDAVWSDWHDDYLPIDDAVWSDWHDTYLLADEAVYSDWFGTNLHRDEARECRYLDDYVPVNSDSVHWSDLSDDYIVTSHEDAVWVESQSEYAWSEDVPRCADCDEIGTDESPVYEYYNGARTLLCSNCLPDGARRLECGIAARPRHNGAVGVCVHTDVVVSTPFGLALRSDCRVLYCEPGDCDMWIPHEYIVNVTTNDGAVLLVDPITLNLGLVPKEWVLNDFFRPVKVVTSRESTFTQITGRTPDDEFVVPLTGTTIYYSIYLDSMIFHIYAHDGSLYAVDSACATEWSREHPEAVFAARSDVLNAECGDELPFVTADFLAAVERRITTHTPFGHSWRDRQGELLIAARARRIVTNLRNYSDSLDYEVIGDGEMSFGLEMEFDYISKGEAVKAIGTAVSEWDGVVLFGVKPDSSTHSGCEVITQPFTASGYAEIRPILKTAIDAIVNTGGRASGGAGLHVHLGGVHVNLRQTATMLSVLSGTGGHWLARFVGRKSDHQLNSYAQLPSGMQCAALAADGVTDDVKKSALGRYSAVNVQPWPKTVEFRLFDAATCIEHVDLALEFVDALYAYSKKREPRHASAWDFVQFAKQGDWATLNQVLSNF